MRVLVATAPFEGLTSAQTGAALARAWAELGAELAVVPIAEAGRGFAQAWSDLQGGDEALAPSVEGFVEPGEVHTSHDADCLALRCRPVVNEDAGSSLALGRAVAALLEEPRPAGAALAELWLDLDGHAWHDGGAGLLAGLGATGDRTLGQGVAALAGITQLDLSAVRRRLGTVTLHLVTDQQQADLQLTGLRGITSVRGHARGDHPGLMLATDQALVDLAAAAGAPDQATTPGSGALGGLGFAVQLLGGDVTTGPRALAELSGLARSMARADLVVTGYDHIEFGTKGGDLLPLVTSLAEQQLRPVVALSRRNWISQRELRTMGLEEAYGLAVDDEVLTEAELTAAAGTVARTWSW